MNIPDPLPLRWIPVPAEVTAVAGCDCGGLDNHRAPDQNHPGCSILRVPYEQAMAAVDAAREREQAFGAALNARLRACVQAGHA